MKIITLNWGRGKTSIGKIISEIELYIQPKGVQFFHVYESGYKGCKNSVRLNNWFWTRVYYVFSNMSGIRYGVGFIPYLEMKYYIWKQKPDLIHIHCPNGHSINLYKLFEYLRKKDIPVVITNHAEFFYTGNCSHSVECMKYTTGCKGCEDYKHKEAGNRICLSDWAWKKMYHALDNSNIAMVAVSPWVMEKMRKSPIALSANKILTTIFNGVNINVFCKKEQKNKSAVIKIFSASGGFNLDVNSNKGGYYLNELAKKCLDLNVEFWVAGSARYEEGISENITFLGHIYDQTELARYYNNADVTLVLSKRETFGMPVAESLCCGTPVIGFKNGGSESIALDDYCAFVDYGDIDSLYQIIKKHAFREFDSDLIEKEAHKRYDSKKMAQNYYNLYLELTKI